MRIPVPPPHMAAANYHRSEDQFLCSICLDVFNDPVTTSCGHNFCKNCLTEHWNTSDQYNCPLCKKVFNTRPELHVNTFISEMVGQSELQESKPGEVLCDGCTGTKLKALKSCLDCLVSYCETHLEPHLTASRLKRHQLIDPVENLEDRMCTKHDKPLELFCKTDQTCVCTLCSVLDHKTHEFVPLKEEYEEKKAKLEETEAEIQQMIQKRQLKIQEIKHSLKTTEKQAEAFIKELEQEICELMKRRTEVQQLSCSEDHLHLIQRVPSVTVTPVFGGWSFRGLNPCQLLYERTLKKAVAQLEETLSEEMKKLVPAELKRVQQYAVDVILDPDTAHPDLILSYDGKQVHLGDVSNKVPNNPKRFSYCVNILGKQSFSSGRFYFEVQVKGKTEWDLGVAREFSKRKRTISLSPQDGFWSIWLRKRNQYEACTNPPVRLSLKCRPEKVGVFVDYEEGLVSFYNVDSAAPIYSFTDCSFRMKLLPYFSPGLNEGGRNSAPLIISPVSVK
uniref:E3 ubiquitin-protein ligase TRIM21-like n=1 Tax=Labrus bergylta TaxID=56723 RepID=A0A3Q3FNX5_9LABR